MTHASISELLTNLSTRTIKSSRLVALLLVATFASVMPAQAQNADAWKSVAIIGGSTAAGAYIGHKVGGSSGAYVGAAVGASAGYAIDRRRRQNQNYNSGYPYGNGGYSGNNGGYYGNGLPYSGNGGYYGDSSNTNPYPSGYQSNSNYVNGQRQVPRQR
ncbi:MAG TPA: hypothetical protein VII81_01640 [Terriglobales bacterium]